jgi:hypothetical protein
MTTGKELFSDPERLGQLQWSNFVADVRKWPSFTFIWQENCVKIMILEMASICWESV